MQAAPGAVPSLPTPTPQHPLRRLPGDWRALEVSQRSSAIGRHGDVPLGTPQCTHRSRRGAGLPWKHVGRVGASFV